MNTYRFKWIEPNDRRTNNDVLLYTSEERIQQAAKSILGRELTSNELALIPGLLTEKLESIAEGENSLFAEVLEEVRLVSAFLRTSRTPRSGGS